MKTLTLILAVATMSGCLSRNLRGPAQDHYVVTAVVAEDCRKGGFGEGKCTQADFDAIADQARCIQAITVRQVCEPRLVEESDTDGAEK